MNYTLLGNSLTVLMAAGPIMWLITHAVINTWKSEDEESVRNSVTDFIDGQKLSVSAADVIDGLRQRGAELRATPDRVTGARHWQLFLSGVYSGGWLCWLSACALGVYVKVISLHSDAAIGPHCLLGVAAALAILTFLGTLAFASLYNVALALLAVVNPRRVLRQTTTPEKASA
jgi:hypothetical protein